MKKIHILGIAPVLTALIFAAGAGAAPSQPSPAKTAKSTVNCPKNGTVIDNVCYVSTGKKPVISSDPTAKPICYPGTYIKTRTGYSCSIKYNDNKKTE